MRYILSSKGSIEYAVIATWEITFINALDPIGTVAIGLYIVSLLYIEKIKQLTPLNFNNRYKNSVQTEFPFGTSVLAQRTLYLARIDPRGSIFINHTYHHTTLSDLQSLSFRKLFIYSIKKNNIPFFLSYIIISNNLFYRRLL